MEGSKPLSVADLLSHRRPFSAAASFPSPTSPPPPKKRRILPPPPAIPPPGPSSLTTRFLCPLPHPALLVGTLVVPDPEGDNPACLSAGSCLVFSDGCARVCCSVLGFDARVVGRRIRVLGWNYVPVESGCGVLEIVRWEFLEPLTGEDDLGKSPLLSLSPAVSSDRSHRSRICGTLASISPMFAVPCTIESRSLQKSCLGDGYRKGGNWKGFLAEISVCDCLMCGGNSERVERVDGNDSSPSSVVVYFCGSASSWRPLLVYLIGSKISIKGVRKKLVSLEAGGSYEMFVTMGGTSVYRCQSSYDLGPIGRKMILASPSVKSYAGIVTGCFMQGFVAELDNSVWVVFPDVTSHSLRVGALVTLSHVHFIRPNYSWEKVLLLGVCSKTNISIKAFSNLETKSHLVSQKQSSLRNLVDSLPFSSKFWLILLISCLRKKFRGAFTDRQILGSKHQKGLIETYARLCLPSCTLYSRYSVITDFCNHNCCNCDRESTFGPLKLVSPISCFIRHCESKWTSRSLNLQNCFTSDAVSACGKYIRRIIHSEEIGVVLLGVLQFSVTSNKLQLHDATGTVDVVVPDLLSDGYLNKLYEVKAYKLIIEGLPHQKKLSGALTESMLSCRNIFNFIQSQRELNEVEVYVHFFLKTALCLNVPFGLSCIKPKDRFKFTRGVNYSILLVAHKYPALSHVHGDSKITEKSSLFAEAIVFPYALLVSSKDGSNNLPNVSEINGRAQLTCFDWDRCSEEISIMRSTCINTSVVADGVPISHKGHVNFEAELTVPCMLKVKGNSSEECLPANLRPARSEKMDGQKILLEFSSDACTQYGVLHIGSFYIMELNMEEEFVSSKVLVTSDSPLWSLSISVSDKCQSKQQDNLSSEYLSDMIEEALLFHIDRTEGPSKNVLSDFHLYLPLELESFLKKFKARTYLQNHVEVTAPFRPSSSVRLKWPLLEGNLVSVRGNIMGVHSVCTIYEDCTLKSRSEICIHVHGENYTVKICGNMLVRPVGMAPGANATFHRVLYTGSSGGCELMLTPVSLVIVNFVSDVSMDTEACSLLCTSRMSIPSKEFYNDLPLCTVSQLFEHCGKRPVRLCCRVLSIHVLLFEHKEQKSSGQFKLLDLGIPLAGFVLGDGSSMCCCWAEEERAADLLCLNEVAVDVCKGDYWTSHCHEGKKNRKTVGYCLQKLLKKHKKISVKKCGSLFDPLSLELKFSTGSKIKLTPKEESLLKFLILDSCCGQVLTIAGDLMNSGDMKHLRKNVEIEDTLQNMQNVWAREVGHINSLHEARNLMRDLTMLHVQN